MSAVTTSVCKFDKLAIVILFFNKLGSIIHHPCTDEYMYIKFSSRGNVKDWNDREYTHVYIDAICIASKLMNST